MNSPSSIAALVTLVHRYSGTSVCQGDTVQRSFQFGDDEPQ
jgi:hypothetical protein